MRLFDFEEYARLLWPTPDTIEKMQWYDWYHGMMHTLFTDASEGEKYASGLSTRDGNPYGGADGNRGFGTLFNIHRMCSEFYQFAVLGDMPVITGNDRTTSDWLAKHNNAIQRMLVKATEDWSITGSACLVVDDDGMHATPSMHVHPVTYPWDPDTRQGWQWLRPFYAGRRENPLVEYQNNRIIIDDIDADGRGMRTKHHVLSGQAIEKLTHSMPSGVKEFQPILDNHQGFYAALSSIAKTINTMVNYHHGQIFRSGGVVFRTMEYWGDAVGMQTAKLRTFLDPAGPAVEYRQGYLHPAFPPRGEVTEADTPVDLMMTDAASGTETMPVIERHGDMLAHAREAISELYREVSLLTGISSAVFGIQQVSSDTEQRENAAFAARARIDEFRREMEPALAKILTAYGCPGEVTVKWPGDILVSTTARRNLVISEYTAGLLTRQEARLALGSPADAVAGEFPDAQSPMADANEIAPQDNPTGQSGFDGQSAIARSSQ